MKKHSITIDGHKTSLSLETEFWEVLQEIARTRGMPLNHLVSEIDQDRLNEDALGGLSSALRVYVLKYVMEVKS